MIVVGLAWAFGMSAAAPQCSFGGRGCCACCSSCRMPCRNPTRGDHPWSLILQRRMDLLNDVLQENLHVLDHVNVLARRQQRLWLMTVAIRRSAVRLPHADGWYVHLNVSKMMNEVVEARAHSSTSARL